MKLNATSEMIPVTWPGFGRCTPSPRRAGQGLPPPLPQDLEATGWPRSRASPASPCSPTRAPRASTRACWSSAATTLRGDRAPPDVCLIPTSRPRHQPRLRRHGRASRSCPSAATSRATSTSPISSAKADEHADKLAALMITYPSTHGVFEEDIREICEIVHELGGQVYMDGANMNAQVGLCRPGDIGADVCHLNLHKTFCIPHGGGGPGMGPIGVAAHLAPFLPGHPVCPHRPRRPGHRAPCRPPPGAAPSILPSPGPTSRMMGADGLKRATEVAILNANYIAKRLQDHYPILYKAQTRPRRPRVHPRSARLQGRGVEVEDVAKRLMDYGFHAPTISWPVPGTLMIEPTESESKAELDRFCDAMIAIRARSAPSSAAPPTATTTPSRTPPTPPPRCRRRLDAPLHPREAAFPHPGSAATSSGPPSAAWTTPTATATSERRGDLHLHVRLFQQHRQPAVAGHDLPRPVAPPRAVLAPVAIYAAEPPQPAPACADPRLGAFAPPHQPHHPLVPKPSPHPDPSRAPSSSVTAATARARMTARSPGRDA
jgi:glycine dehydrogenase